MTEITAIEAAERLGISRSAMYARCRRGDVAARRVGRRWLVDESCLPPVEARSTVPEYLRGAARLARMALSFAWRVWR